MFSYLWRKIRGQEKEDSLSKMKNKDTKAAVLVDSFTRYLFLFSGIFIIVILLLIVIFLFRQSVPFFATAKAEQIEKILEVHIVRKRNWVSELKESMQAKIKYREEKANTILEKLEAKATKKEGYVSYFAGDVEVSYDKKVWKKIKKDETLSQNMAIRTGNDSFVQFMLWNNASFILSQNTTVFIKTFSLEEQTFHIVLEQGDIYANNGIMRSRRKIPVDIFENKVLKNVSETEKQYLLSFYKKNSQDSEEYTLIIDAKLPLKKVKEIKHKVSDILEKAGYSHHGFYRIEGKALEAFVLAEDEIRDAEFDFYTVEDVELKKIETVKIKTGIVNVRRNFEGAHSKLLDPSGGAMFDSKEPGVTVSLLENEEISKKIESQKSVYGDFFFGKKWNPTSDVDVSYGLLPLILGTLFTTIGALVIAIPIGIGTAIFLSEYAKGKFSEFMKFFIEILSSIPSVVVGFIGLVMVGPWIASLTGASNGLNALNGSILLAIMSLPTIISISTDSIREVPQSLREASIGMGASKWETIVKVIIPTAKSGILASFMLGLGRAIGETMTVLMVTGNSAIIPTSFFDSVRTMTATIAIELGEVAFGSAHYHSLFAVGFVLFVMSFIVNLISDFLIHRRKI